MSNVLEPLLTAFRQTVASLPDPRHGRNKRYSLPDAASCAFSLFFLQSPSFLHFQRRMQEQTSRSHCQTLFTPATPPCPSRRARPTLCAWTCSCSS